MVSLKGSDWSRGFVGLGWIPDARGIQISRRKEYSDQVRILLSRW